MENGVERSLGRIEGGINEALNQIKQLRDDFGVHKNDDQRNFSNIRRQSSELTASIAKQFEENDRARNQHLNEQDLKLDEITARANFAKGAGWVIIGLLGAMATIIGGCVIAVFAGWIKVHW